MVDITEIVESHSISDLRCILCNYFLSVPPILIDVHGKSKCGRCKSDISADLYLHNIYYEKLAHQFQFPCKFTKEGCSAKIHFDEVRSHEVICPYQSIECGAETCGWSGIPTELITHYNKHHQELMVEKDHLEKELAEDTLDSGSCIELQCEYCKNFLSVPPILLDQHGKNICGRCESETHSDLVYVHNSFYENLARQFCFPCSFISEGGPFKKSFEEMKTHEEICPYQTIKCRVERCEWSGTVSELIIHYNKSHQELTIGNNCIQKLAGEEGCFVLVTDGFYFLLEWEYHELKFKLQIKSLSILASFDDVFYFSLFSVDSKLPVKTNSGSINSSVTSSMQDLQKDSLPRLFSISVLLSADTMYKNKKNLEKIVCPYCKHQMVPPILRCHVGHITCVDCTTPYYDTCPGCDVDELHFTRVPELELIAQLSRYTCQWKNCNENFNVRKIQEHEQNCPKRIFECRHCCVWTGFVNEIISHDVVCTHKNYPRCMLMDNQVTVLGTDIKEIINENMEYWLIAFNEYFAVDFQPQAEGVDVKVSNYGLPSLFGWYCYEVDLQHVENLNFPLNKTYEIRDKCSNVYVVLIPSTDTAEFGGPEFYKITVKIRLLCDTDRSADMSFNYRIFD